MNFHPLSVEAKAIAAKDVLLDNTKTLEEAAKEIGISVDSVVKYRLKFGFIKPAKKLRTQKGYVLKPEEPYDYKLDPEYWDAEKDRPRSYHEEEGGVVISLEELRKRGKST